MSGNQKETSPHSDSFLLENPQILSLADFSNTLQNPISDLANIYAHTWTTDAHLPTSTQQAQEKINSWNPQNSFVLTENGQGIYGQIHTARVHLESFDHLLHLIPNYQAAENLMKLPPDPQANYCFCIAVCCADTGIRIKTPIGSISRVEYLIKNLPFDSNIRRLPISFAAFPNNHPDKLVSYITQTVNSNNTRSLGPAGLHLHFGAKILAVILNSRPEHDFAAQSNVILAYPTPKDNLSFNQSLLQLTPHINNVWVNQTTLNSF